MVATVSAVQPATAQHIRAGVTYQTFYNELQPYGNWINYPGYGYVWQPAMGNGFRPYETNGYWVPTEDGWAWASDYNWGWAPFHYGRWLLEPALGWVWVPGYEWAPAWVQWGSNSNYYGWASLSPGSSIGFGNSWRAPAAYWCYVPHNYIRHQHLNRYIVRNNVKNIDIINNYNTYNKKDFYHRGPKNSEVEKYTSRPVKPLAIVSIGKPGRTKADNRFEVYRPQVTNVGNVQAVPQSVKNLEEIKAQQNGNIGTLTTGGIKPVKGSTKATVEDNAVIHPVPGKPAIHNTGGTRTTIIHTPASPQYTPAPQGGVKGNNGNIELPVEQLPPSPPIKTGGIKPPPPADNSIITKLPPPVDPQKMQHRNEPTFKPIHQPNNQPPMPKPIQSTRPVRPTREVNPGGQINSQPRMQHNQPSVPKKIRHLNS